MQLRGIVRKDFKLVKSILTENSLKGLKVAVVGGTNGIGQGITHELAAKGADVTAVGRTFRDQGLKNISFVEADFSTVAKAQELAKKLPAEQYDILVFTTGILAGPKRVENTEGIEMDMAVSYLSRYVITKETAPKLGLGRIASEEATKLIKRPRIFVMGFPGVNQVATIDDFNSEKAYNFMNAHQNTVVANEALVLHGATTTPAVDFFGLNPGFIRTNIRVGPVYKEGWLANAFESVVGLFNPTVKEYAQGIVPLLVHPELEGKSGMMFNQSGQAIHGSKNLPAELVNRLMEESDKLVQKALQKK